MALRVSLALVPSEELLVPIVLLQALAVAAGSVGCEQSIFCDCIARDFAGRAPYVILFSFLSLAFESVFSRSVLSWLGYPLLVATFATANDDLPDWAWHHSWSLHVWLIVAAALVEATVALYRCVHYGLRSSAALVVVVVFMYGLVQTIRTVAGGEQVFLTQAQGIISTVSYVVTRCVAAATIGRTRRELPVTERAVATDSRPLLPFGS